MSSITNKKCISIGINPRWTLDEAQKLLRDFQDILESVYFTPLIEKSHTGFTTMQGVVSAINNDEAAAERMLKIIGFAKDLGLRTDVVFNTSLCSDEDLEAGYDFIKEIDADDITMLPQYADFFKRMKDQRKHIYSFNAKKPNIDDYKDPFFDSFVLDSQYLWRKELRPKNAEARLLLNSGCPSACPGCEAYKNSVPCSELFYKELQKKNFEQYLAYHSLFFRDIQLYQECFPDENFVFKAGTRNNDAYQVRVYLNFFLNECGIGMLFDCLSKNNSSILYRYVEANKICPPKLDYDVFYREKSRLWSEATGINIVY